MPSTESSWASRTISTPWTWSAPCLPAACASRLTREADGIRRVGSPFYLSPFFVTGKVWRLFSGEQILSMSIETSSGSGTLHRSVHRKRVAEHRPTALGLLLGRLVLDDIPMLNEDTIHDPEDVRRDPVHGCPEPGKPPMNDHKVATSHDHPRLVFQRRRHAFDEVEEALAAGSNVRAVLDVCG